MSLRYGVVVANVTEDTQGFWIKFKSVAKAEGVSYTKALEQAVELWLQDRGETGHPPVQPLANPFK